MRAIRPHPALPRLPLPARPDPRPGTTLGLSPAWDDPGLFHLPARIGRRGSRYHHSDPNVSPSRAVAIDRDIRRRRPDHDPFHPRRRAGEQRLDMPPRRHSGAVSALDASHPGPPPSSLARDRNPAGESAISILVYYSVQAFLTMSFLLAPRHATNRLRIYWHQPGSGRLKTEKTTRNDHLRWRQGSDQGSENGQRTREER